MNTTLQNVMPHQLSKFIELTKQKITLACHVLEMSEMHICLLENNLKLKQQMEVDVERLRKENSFINKNIRKAISHYEQILKADEEANGWKGPDRWVDFNILQKKINGEDNF